MKIYAVRHGETKENANDCLGGRINSSLTDEGIKQAYQIKEYLDNQEFDLIISSPLERCKQTANIIGENKKIIYSDKLLGRDHGEFTGCPKSLVNYDDYWNYNLDLKFERAENIRDLYNRVASLIEDLKENYNDKNIVIVTHSGILRIIYYYFNGIPKDGKLGEITIRNCEVFEYDI